MAIEMTVVNPHPTETYRVGLDDHRVVVSSGDEPDAPKVWLSKSMLKWLGTEGLRLLQVLGAGVAE